jgi:hypothetical protein
MERAATTRPADLVGLAVAQQLPIAVHPLQLNRYWVRVANGRKQGKRCHENYSKCAP